MFTPCIRKMAEARFIKHSQSTTKSPNNPRDYYYREGIGTDISQRGHADSQQAYEKLFREINYQRQANKTDNEISYYISKNGTY